MVFSQTVEKGLDLRVSQLASRHVERFQTCVVLGKLRKAAPDMRKIGTEDVAKYRLICQNYVSRYI